MHWGSLFTLRVCPVCCLIQGVFLVNIPYGEDDRKANMYPYWVCYLPLTYAVIRSFYFDLLNLPALA